MSINNLLRRMREAVRHGAAQLEPAESASEPKIASTQPRSYKWPDTSSPDEDAANGRFGWGLSINGTSYKKAEVEPGRWQWVVDKEIEAVKRRYEARRKELWQALQTRVISDDEMDEVLRLGEDINIPFNQSYNSEQKQRERGNAFVTQERLRAARRSGGLIGAQP